MYLKKYRHVQLDIGISLRKLVQSCIVNLFINLFIYYTSCRVWRAKVDANETSHLGAGYKGRQCTRVQEHKLCLCLEGDGEHQRSLMTCPMSSFDFVHTSVHTEQVKGRTIKPVRPGASGDGSKICSYNWSSVYFFNLFTKDTSSVDFYYCTQSTAGYFACPGSECFYKQTCRHACCLSADCENCRRPWAQW